MYNSDYEKMGEEEMQWHDDGYLGSNFEGEAKKSIKVFSHVTLQRELLLWFTFCQSFIGVTWSTPNGSLFSSQDNCWCNKSQDKINIIASVKTVLRWLPYSARVKFCVLKAVALSLIGTAPSYLSELLRPLCSIPGQSTAQGLLSVSILKPHCS